LAAAREDLDVQLAMVQEEVRGAQIRLEAKDVALDASNRWRCQDQFCLEFSAVPVGSGRPDFPAVREDLNLAPDGHSAGARGGARAEF